MLANAQGDTRAYVCLSNAATLFQLNIYYERFRIVLHKTIECNASIIQKMYAYI